MTTMQREPKNERGVALVAFAVSMAALFALAAVAVDMGRLATVAEEVQAVADAAATGGAERLLKSGTAAQAQADAQAVVGQNMVAGATATIATSAIEVGQYNPTTNTFTPGATPPDAVRATPSATVQNLFVGIFGSSFLNTTVTKTATAGFTGLGSAAPTLPLVIGDCNFGQFKECTLDPSCLPQAFQVPSQGNSAFIKTGTYLPASCGGNGSVLNVGDTVNLTNGQTPNLKPVSDCFNSGVTQFTIPVVSCTSTAGNWQGSAQVVGFATVTVTAVQATGSPKTVTFNAIESQLTGPAGGIPFGTGNMRLFN
jgi:Flp pilus assembly protein TadG